jgi:hypothetical protein
MVEYKINYKFHIKNIEMNLYFLAKDRIELTTKDFQSHTLPIKLFGSKFISNDILQKVGFLNPLRTMFFFELKSLSFYK